MSFPSESAMQAWLSARLSERIGLDEQVCLQVFADLQGQVGPALMKAQR